MTSARCAWCPDPAAATVDGQALCAGCAHQAALARPIDDADVERQRLVNLADPYRVASRLRYGRRAQNR